MTRPHRAMAMEPPDISGWAVRLFARYTRRYLRQHFYAVRLNNEPQAAAFTGAPLIVYLNHASWWDPLVCLLVQQSLFAHRKAYAPIAADALARYPFFSRLGFFGIDQGTPRGALQFLNTSQRVLERPDTILWITPQGRFRDVRERPAGFQSGLGHLAARQQHGWMLPLAIEYVFWEERLPEVLLRFGTPMPLDALPPRAREGLNPAERWTIQLQQSLERAQDQLADEACERNPARFRLLLGGRAGVGPIYDTIRRLRAFCTGSTFRPQHGGL